ncbi:DeoR faimly transcriptional regulator [Brachybacterium phenoliresistens]|uniref:DeoR faimly transcriptional regulator n=1 Tax=Brachybacterium phenoliresistens TaxID=396014 RepID=Z9JWL5_9MICO|nr:WYL domain-containing protein [Brachybacterium phenoliresistens]EWS82172.1 DeoR faimly transcriptional regulator [Brachybacterium phenoliresistens]
MLRTSARLLDLLALLQVRRDWTSSQLAVRLAVSTRTVRADVARLRSLGYQAEARPGIAGGYRLAAGTMMPPLQLDDEEAVAVALALGSLAAAGSGGGETALCALAKLEQVLPARLRPRLAAVREATSTVPGAGSAPDLPLLGAIAAAIRGRERLRCGYTKPGGEEETRRLEPQRLVSWGPLWYLLAWDLDRGDWRVFRVDRIRRAAASGARFRARADPADDAVDFVVRRVSIDAWTSHALVLVHAPAAEVVAALGVPVDVETVDETSCRVAVGSRDPDRLALWLIGLGVDLEVLEGRELAAAFERLAARLHRATR